jgi:hypothetical protein
MLCNYMNDLKAFVIYVTYFVISYLTDFKYQHKYIHVSYTGFQVYKDGTYPKL